METTLEKSETQTNWYVRAMQRLIDVVQALSHARDLESVMGIVRKAARELTGADGATFVLRDGNYCYYAEENAISPLWKGQRFPMETCISGWVMLNKQPVVIEDIYQDSRIPQDAYRPTFVKSLAMVPIRTENPLGAIGNYWATQYRPTPEQLAILQALANVTCVAMQNVDLYERLQENIRALKVSNEELAGFAWAASHDLKSPLRAIDNLSKWIEESIRAGEEQETERQITLLRGRVRRMEKLLDDMLEYAQVEYKLSDATEETVDGATLKKDVPALLFLPETFTLRFDGAFDSITVPRTALLRILCALIGNAVKHHDRKQGEIVVSVADEGAIYRFCVKDDGPGIAPEYRKKIFDMFQTLRPRDSNEGSGMGLALVKKILALRGGAITVESAGAGGRGALFCFIWPKLPERMTQ